MSSTSEFQEPSKKDKFDLLFGLLKDHYAGLIDFEFKHGVVLTLILGWIIASKDARSFIFEFGNVIAPLLSTLILLYTAFHGMWVCRFFGRSKEAFASLVKLGYMDSDYFRPRRIHGFTVVSFIILHALVSVGICVFVILAAFFAADPRSLR